MDRVSRITYFSKAVRPMGDDELLQLLTGARAKNAKREITGMLVYKDGCFLQVLEGSAPVVERLCARIAQDPRHDAMTILHQDFGPRRFAEWSMGFQNLSNIGFTEKSEGRSDLMSIPFDADYFGANPSKAEELLLCFRGLNDPRVVATL